MYQSTMYRHVSPTMYQLNMKIALDQIASLHEDGPYSHGSRSDAIYSNN